MFKYQNVIDIELRNNCQDFVNSEPSRGGFALTTTVLPCIAMGEKVECNHGILKRKHVLQGQGPL